MRGAFIAAALAAGVLSGCMPVNGASTQSLVAQRQAISACIGTVMGDLPQGSRVALDTTLRNGSYTLRVVPGGAIGAAEAAAINACAAQRVSGDISTFPQPEGARARAEAELMRQYSGGTYTANGCPPRSSVMYGGTRYCVGSHY